MARVFEEWPTCSPFLKWAGGKRKLLPAILPLIGDVSERVYVEPFVGSGAVFFGLTNKPRKSILADRNWRLVEALAAVQRRPREVADLLLQLSDSRETFYEVRRWMNTSRAVWPDMGAAVIYTNKTGFNGLWRENKAGEFNVPYAASGHERTFFELGNLLRCSVRLQGAALIRCSYKESVNEARSLGMTKRLTIYMDPPYIPTKATSFTSYTANGFTEQDHVELRDLAVALKRDGARVVLSNSASPLVRELYGGHFKITEISRSGAMNSNGADRGRVAEVLIHE